MKFSENWLRSLVDLPTDTATLERRFNMIGHEVESIERLGTSLDHVVVGEIVACEKHPQADRLNVCQVSIGNEKLQIVCGAPNARVGLKAPLAMVGAKLPNGIEIKKAALRGVESNGMLCSAKELLLDADASGLLELAADAPTGKSLTDYLGLPDKVIELGLTPNRADCLSLRGLAIDVAAAFDAKLKADSFEPVAAQTKREVEIKLNAGADCPRYVGRVIEGVDPTAITPLWMTERLRRSGIRPVSVLVDITQYVMLELGQPMHAYDAAKLDGDIDVRRARDDEKAKLLDGKEYSLSTNYLVIADASECVGVAGIMGGLDSRVTDTTRDIFLEAAHFAPATIMGRARNLSLHTDASHRFERGVDPELPRTAMERATSLVMSIAGGTPGPISEVVIESALPKRHSVSLRRARLSRVLGITVADDEVSRILSALDMKVQRTNDGWTATPPSRRFDIEIEEDLIEEVARIHGYDNVPTHAPSGELSLHLRPESEVSLSRMNSQMASSGYREAICYSFVAPELLQKWSLSGGAVALANPLSADLAVMRTSLLPGLVEILKSNRNRQQERVRLFESGLIFNNASGTLSQIPHIAAVACGRAHPESWSGDKRGVDFYDLKADVENLLALASGERAVEFRPANRAWLHPGRSAEVFVDGKPIGVVGGLNPRLLRALDIDEDVQVFELDVASVTAGAVPTAKPVSRFPSVRRDIAIVVPEHVAYARVESTARQALQGVLADLLVFDQFVGQNLGSGVKSLAIGLILQDDSRTLTDQDADGFVAKAVTALEQECQARLRG
ncbi:MAG: phenylalanine--tRNA ligase subunit beta [Rudaea sp.]